VKILVIFDTKYGNTKLAATSILEGIREVEEIESDIGYVKEVDLERIVGYDAIVLGAPNHMGRPSRTMKKFIDKLASLDLAAKYIAVFGTYSGRIRPVDRSLRKLEKMVSEKLPNLELVLPGLSVRVNGVSGPIVSDELPKCVDFGKKIASYLKNQ
jgi:flavorubredoxin